MIHVFVLLVGVLLIHLKSMFHNLCSGFALNHLILTLFGNGKMGNLRDGA
jgi:hypothetical protein